MPAVPGCSLSAWETKQPPSLPGGINVRHSKRPNFQLTFSSPQMIERPLLDGPLHNYHFIIHLLYFHRVEQSHLSLRQENHYGDDSQRGRFTERYLLSTETSCRGRAHHIKPSLYNNINNNVGVGRAYNLSSVWSIYCWILRQKPE